MLKEGVAKIGDLGCAKEVAPPETKKKEEEKKEPQEKPGDDHRLDESQLQNEELKHLDELMEQADNPFDMVDDDLFGADDNLIND
jgi:hypothetical protein|tara:strand:+ start:715 stop:969 length:255 start_codon:yes stop_codon:yes gene_type:complete